MLSHSDQGEGLYPDNEPHIGGQVSLIPMGQSEYRGSCRSPGVDLSSSIEEYLDDVDVTPRSSQAERRVVGNIAVFLIRSPKQQQLNHLTETNDSCRVKAGKQFKCHYCEGELKDKVFTSWRPPEQARERGVSLVLSD